MQNTTHDTENININQKNILGTVEELFLYSDEDFDLSLNEEVNEIITSEEHEISVPDICKLFPETTPQGVNHILKTSIGITPTKRGRTNYLKSSEVRSLFKHYGYDYSKQSKVLAFLATKGGVGKTTSTRNVAHRLNQYGFKVLVIDIDPQGNTTQTLGINGDNHYVMYDVISKDSDKKEIKMKDAILKLTPNYHLLPSGSDNALLDTYLTMREKRVDLLFNGLIDSVKKDYDIILFDCSPSLSLLNSGVLLSSSEVIIPQTPDSFSFKSVGNTLKWLRDVTEEYDSDRSKKVKVFFNKYDHLQTSKDFLMHAYSEKVLTNFNMKTAVRNCEEIRKKQNVGESIFSSNKKTTIRDDMDSLVKELVDLKQLKASKSLVQ
jgi:chromosome partitioning protein